MKTSLHILTALYLFLVSELIFARQHHQNSLIACHADIVNVQKYNFKVQLIEYRTNFDKYTVFVLPPSGGKTFLDAEFARRLCLSGINSYIIKTWSQKFEYDLALEEHQHFYEKSQRAIDLAVEYTGSNNVGVLGTSLGGIIATLAVQRNSNIKTAFVIAAGADIPSIIANSDQEMLRETKAKRMRIFNIKSIDHYIAAIRKVFFLEPLDIKFNRSDKKLGMLTIAKDKIVPTYNQYLLRDYWRPDLLIHYRRSTIGKIISDTHKGSIIEGSIFYRRKIINFFKESRHR